MNKCVVCKTLGTTKAHVKDKSECIKGGISDHKHLNIIELCYNCHYLLFDKGKMGIKKENKNYYFYYLNDNNSVEKKKSLYTLNVLDSYIEWKNKRCKPKLWSKLF